MSSRAVKFLHDLAKADNDRKTADDTKKTWTAADAAVEVLRTIIGTDKSGDDTGDIQSSEPFDPADPLRGWSDGVSAVKTHYCILFKPQVVLRSDQCAESSVVLTSSDVSLQIFHVIDLQNRNDPIAGRIMNR